VAAPGRLVLVEYDTDHGNPWVPPLTFGSWAALASEAGFRETRRLASVPSRFLGSIYSAVSLRCDVGIDAVTPTTSIAAPTPRREQRSHDHESHCPRRPPRENECLIDA
jgi:hypothetical protein